MAMAAPDRSAPDDRTIAGTISGSRGSRSAATSAPGAAPLLEVGTVLADRYEILAVLGEGGMGAVYKAHDRELDRVVALKTIRPEMAASADMLARFKQEVLLASQITHPNVIRLYDLGESAGLKFITMEFVEGDDLRSLLYDQGKFGPAEALEIVRQVCLALECAHGKGVIHRDLKPQNVMRDRQGRVVVMDFGLARSQALDGMTQTGALIGTMEYMSPEQALGKPVDHRSDIFAVGLIFYELLSGKQPFQADSALASLLKRSQERALPVSDVDVAVPRQLSNVVGRCLERDPEKRYQSVTELLADLELHTGAKPGPAVLRVRLPRPKTWVIVTVCALILAAGAMLMLRSRLWPARAHAVAAPEISLAILPLRNASGDASLDWLGSSVADMLGTDIGQSAQLRTIASARVEQILQDLRIGTANSIDDSTARRVANFSNADVIVWGQYVRLGSQLRLDLTIRDLKHDRNVPIKATAANENELGSVVDKLAQEIRSNLALSRDVVEHLQASAFKPSTGSVEALREYDDGVGKLRLGKNLEAQNALANAVKADPKFALAFSKLAQAYANLGYGDKAEQASRSAVELSDALPLAEKYEITAEHARVIKDYPKAVEAYNKLAEVWPQDTDVQFALARLYEDTHAFDKAHDYYEKLLVRDPKNVDALVSMGRLNNLRGDFQGALDYLNRAVALAIQLNNDERKAAALSYLGEAYFHLNQLADALRNCQESLDIRRAQGDQGGVADALNRIALVQQALEQPAQALKSYQEALRVRRQIGDKHGTANTLGNLGNFYDVQGQYDQAIDFTKQALQLERDLGDSVNVGQSLNNIGWVYLEKGDYENATTYLQQALDLREKLKDPGAIAETLDNLGNASAKMGQYDAAVNYFLRDLDLWRKADDPTGLANAQYDMGIVFLSQGRYGAALKAESDALEGFRKVKEQGLLLAMAQGGYGEALASVGRNTDAEQNLKSALAMARQLKNENLTGHLLNAEGTRSFYGGDYRTATASFEQALSSATRAKNQEGILTAKLGLAKVLLQEGRVHDALQSLRTLADQTRQSGTRYLSLETSTYLADALLHSKDYASAEDELNRTLAACEQLNLTGLQLRSHYLLARVLHLSGNEQEATHHDGEVKRLLEQIRKEAGTNDILKRSDFAAMTAH